MPYMGAVLFLLYIFLNLCSGEGPHAHLKNLAECIRWSYGAGVLLRLGNIARLELNYCIPMGVQSGDKYAYELASLALSYKTLAHALAGHWSLVWAYSESIIQCRMHVLYIGQRHLNA